MKYPFLDGKVGLIQGAGDFHKMLCRNIEVEEGHNSGENVICMKAEANPP